MLTSGPTQTTLDEQVTFVGGQDASKTPDFTPENCYFAGVNVSCKDGAIGPRDGFRLLELTYPEGGVELPGRFPIPYQQIFESGKFQSFIPYTIGETPYIIVVVSGVIFLIDQNTYAVQILTLADGDMLNQYAPRLNWSLASRFIVIFDYPNFPVIIEDASARRADPAKFEVPISTIGAYNQNRLAIGNAGNEFTYGDPTGSLAAPDAPITFMEVEQIGSPYFGQIFQLPTEYANNPITYMGFLTLTDTSTGIGPHIIGTNNQVYAFNTQNPRATWQNGPFGSVVVANAGIAGARAFTNLNSDAFFLSPDGQIRSLSMSRDEQKKWSKTPLSREVKNWLKVREPALLRYASLTYFDNKILATVNPYRVTARTLLQEPIADYTHGGMVVMELENISTLRQDAQPVWAGLWTGVRPMDFCVNAGRCFIMSKDNETVNRLWEMTPGVTVDKLKGVERYIESKIYTRYYNGKNSFLDKEFLYFTTELSDVRGDFALELSYRPAHAPAFLPWGSFAYKAPYRTCIAPVGCLVNGFSPHAFREVKIGAPDSFQCDAVTQELYRRFRMAQLRLKITGRSWQLSHFQTKSLVFPEADASVVCLKYPSVSLCKPCDEDWIIPPVSTCDLKET